ncbi:MAG: cysteine hydrolase [bacterium]
MEKDSVSPIDRSAMIERMKDELHLEAGRAAVVTIDCQRGNLDPEIASLPVPEAECRRILGGINRLLTGAREAGIPVIHVDTVYEESLLGKHPFEQAMLSAKESFTPHRQSDFARHKSPGSPEAELMPEIDVRPDDYRVGSKRTFDMFYGTQLEILLRSLSVVTLLVAGCNTNTCVLASAFGAYVRNFRVVVLSDCVASAYGEDLHVFALSNIQRRLGWVLTLDELEEKLGISRPASAGAAR